MTKIKSWLHPGIIALLFSSGLFAQNITKGPWLADPGKASITVRWESGARGDFTVAYGTDKSLTLEQKARFIEESHGGFLYEKQIDGLKPEQTYFYQVRSDNQSSSISTFKCALPKQSPVSFVVMGDSRSNPKIFGAISDEVNVLNPDIILSVGDLVREGGSYEQWDKYYFNVARNVIDHIPLISALGDHEADSVDGDEAVLFTHFLFPHKNHLKLWFSFDYGDAHFVALDYRYPYNDEMIEWFKKDMAASKARWKFVYMHCPSYNLGGHRSTWGRDIWPKLFSQYKVDIVFAGHSHLYERFYPIRPQSDPDAWAVTYITTGGAGASLYAAVQSPFLAFSKSVNHFVYIRTDNDSLHLKTFLNDGSVLDKVSWGKTKNGSSLMVKSQDELDLIGMFAGTISASLERLPMKEIPAVSEITLKPVFVKEDVHFKISLAKESKKSYQMQPVQGTIKNGRQMQIFLKIYARGTMTVSRWGDIQPELKLVADYQSKSFHGSVESKEIEYRAY
ncbi:MAG: hypothetical protein GWP06_13765 [Actinobacteria bacterium]|nr:hypothetical protein [Actinomycetota bacterium]